MNLGKKLLSMSLTLTSLFISYHCFKPSLDNYLIKGYPVFLFPIVRSEKPDSCSSTDRSGFLSSSLSSSSSLQQSNVTLREYLSHEEGFHLAMAPSFFGFYGYFGALIALEEELGILPQSNATANAKLMSVAGASAGAMAAVLLAAGINPRLAAEFASSLNLKSFADPLGYFALFKGDKFEQIMKDYIIQEHSMDSAKDAYLEHALIPVAVTSFDIKTWRSKVLTKGCMAKAARASATFPFLFQPAAWTENQTVINSDDKETTKSFLIDGGISDPHGLNGLSVLLPDATRKRIVNMVVGEFGFQEYPRLEDLQQRNIDASSILSISIQNTPRCGPWAMQNGPLAVEAARLAIAKFLDMPLYNGREEGHYELHIDASNIILQ